MDILETGKSKVISRYKLNSIFMKVFISYICILLLILLSSAFIYYYIKSILIEKEINVDSEYLLYVSKIVDNQFINLKDAMYGLILNNRNMQSIENINNYSNQYNLTTQLYNFKNSWSIVDSCFIYNRSLDFVLGDQGSISKSSLLTDISKSSNTNPKTILEKIEGSKEFRYIPTTKYASDFSGSIKYSTKNIITLLAGINYSSCDNQLMIFVNEQNIRAVINDANIVKYGNIYIVNNEGNIISSSDMDQAAGVFDQALLSKIRLYDGKSGSLLYKNNLIVFQKSSFLDWYYTTVIPYGNILKNIYVVRNIFIYVLVTVLFIGIFIAFLFSNTYYSPIANIIGNFKTLQIDRFKYRDEFAFISGIIKYMQDITRSYEDDSLILNILSTGAVNKQLEESFKYQFYQLVLIKSSIPCRISEYVKNFLKSIPHELYDFKTVKLTENECCLIINSEKIEREEIIKLVTALKEQIEKEHDTFLVIGIGNMCNDLSEIQTSFENATLAIGQGDSSSTTYIYEYDRSQGKNCNIYFPIDFYITVTDYIYSMRKDAVSKYLEKIFETNRGVPNIYMKNVVAEFINKFITLANKFNYDIDINSIHKSVDNEYRVSSLTILIKNLYEELLRENYIPNDRARQIENYVVNYIENNYSNPSISIEKIGDEMNFSHAYISTLFKRSKGVGFSQYLLEYRVSKAKELLENTQVKVKDVAEKAGFGTYNNFARAFRKITGVSPSDYRQKVEEK